MNTQKKQKWAVALMILPMVMFLPSILNFFIPATFVDLYLVHDANISIAELQETHEGIASVLLLGFRGMGFTIIGYHLLAWPIILIPYRKGEKWTLPVLLIAQIFIWTANAVLEYQHNGTFFMVAYSLVAIIAITVSVIIWKNNKK